MLFSNLSFIFIFLPILMFIYFLVSQKRKNIVLLLASLVFYAWGGPVYVVLLFLSTVFNYFCGRDLEEKKEDPMRKKRSLVFGIVINLLILGFFKYYVFLMESINALVSAELPYRELAVPIGISIYTLRAISYLADIYRGEAAQAKFVDLALYLGMFPQISAGPVDRYVNIAGQLGKRPLSVRRFGNGAMLFVCGLAKKVILADSAGILQEQITGLQIGTFSVLTAWIGCAAFAFRFYFELSGYADMAIGLGRMLGFDLQRNFYDPYASRSVTEFWKRWNSSLTLWVRAYIYEPLEKKVQEASGRIWNHTSYGNADRILVWGRVEISLVGDLFWDSLSFGTFCIWQSARTFSESDPASIHSDHCFYWLDIFLCTGFRSSVGLHRRHVWSRCKRTRRCTGTLFYL